MGLIAYWAVIQIVAWMLIIGRDAALKNNDNKAPGRPKR